MTIYVYRYEKIDVGHFWDLKVSQRRRRECQNCNRLRLEKQLWHGEQHFCFHFFAITVRLRREIALCDQGQIRGGT